MSGLAKKFMPTSTAAKQPSNENKLQRRGVVLALEIVLDNGASDIIPYSWLRRVRFAADRQSIEVHFTEASYLVTGTRLHSLANGLKRQSLDLLEPTDSSIDPTPGDDETPYITSVTELDTKTGELLDE